MEEKKTKTKAVKTAEQQKLSYEQLNDACMQLYQQNQKLTQQLQRANVSNMFARLEFLFKVLNYSSLFDKEFVGACVSEIEDAMTIKAEEKSEEA